MSSEETEKRRAVLDYIVNNKLSIEEARKYSEAQGVKVLFFSTPKADNIYQAKQNADDLNQGVLHLPYVQTVLEKWAIPIIASESVAVPHEEEEMNWRLFFAHSQDMMGFRADIFTGGWNEANNPYYPHYQGLRDRWPESKTLIQGLANLWRTDSTRNQLIQLTTGPQTGDTSVGPVVAILRGEHGNPATHTFADALDALQGAKIAFKTRRMVRAYIQNSALLMEHDASFMRYLQSIVPDLFLPAQQVIEAERAWRKAIERDFYNVGPAIANYLISDWLLWLWREGQIEWFESYKADSVFLKTMADAGKLPADAVADFPSYCKGLSLRDFVDGEYWVIKANYAVPPRVLNEAIWLEEATTNQINQEPVSVTHKVSVDIEHTAWPNRFYQLWAENVEEDLTGGSHDVAIASNDTNSSIILFRDNEEGFLDWLRANAEGFVVNANRTPNAKYLILHRSSCWCISRPLKNGEKWTVSFIKVCANDSQSLHIWARDEVGGVLHRCGICCGD